jgi:hypothetical protein
MVLYENITIPKNLFWTHFSELSSWIGPVEMSMRDTTCVASFVKIRSGIKK